MTVAPEASLSLPFDRLRTMVANSVEFQTWRGVELEPDPVEAAKAFIHLLETPAPADKQRYTKAELETLRPLALIGWPRGAGLNLRRVAGGLGLTFLESMPLYLAFEDTVDTSGPIEDTFFTFTNHVGKVIADMEKLAGTDDFLALSNLAVDDFWREDPDATTGSGDYWWIRFLVEWDV